MHLGTYAQTMNYSLYLNQLGIMISIWKTILLLCQVILEMKSGNLDELTLRQSDSRDEIWKKKLTLNNVLYVIDIWKNFVSSLICLISMNSG